MATVQAPGASVSASTWLGFAAMCLGMFMAFLDMQIVAVALPTIRTALGIGADAMSWIQTAYIIAEVISIPITGLLTRALSMRWLVVLGVLLFTIASAGCAASQGFTSLIVWRVVQGLAAGALIPAVFSGVFVLFPARLEALATSLAGVVAVLAPTVGPIIGGSVTHAWNWHWLFIINLPPGILAMAIAWTCLPRDTPRPALLARLDWWGLLLLAVSLAALVIGLKQAPGDGWGSPVVLGLLALSVVAGVLFVRRSLRVASPCAELSVFRDRRTAVGCTLNFAFGFGLFGMIYLMPVFLALVRDHDALEIGKIMLVTGVAELLAAPVAVMLEKRTDPRWLSLFGFLLFAAGLALGGRATPDTDYHAMFVPQVIRGIAVMFCLLPPTRLALGHWPDDEIANASGLFNVMRNLGGAIGIALIDTILYGGGPRWADWITARLQACDTKVASAVGIPLDAFRDACGQPIDQDTRDLLAPMVKKLALLYAINEAWWILAAITLVACLALFGVRRRTGGVAA